MKDTKTAFIVTPFLTAIDGPDGAGKSTFSEILAEEFQKIMRTVLVRPTRFDSSKETMKIQTEFQKKSKRIKPHSKSHNSFFLNTAGTNYRNLVLPLIKDGQFVIVDSSELRALAFILEKGTSQAINDTIDQISRGSLTCSIKPAKRIILFGDPLELHKNLSTKKFLDTGDPKNITEIKRRIKFYRKAIKLIQEIEGKGVDWIYIRISHSEKPVKDYFLSLISEHSLIARLAGDIL
jgi:thymidylate kinase